MEWVASANGSSFGIYLFYLCVNRDILILILTQFKNVQHSESWKVAVVSAAGDDPTVYRWPSNIFFDTTCVTDHVYIFDVACTQSVQNMFMCAFKYLHAFVCMSIVSVSVFLFFSSHLVYRVWHELLVWIPVSDRTFSFVNASKRSKHGHNIGVQCILHAKCVVHFFEL